MLLFEYHKLRQLVVNSNKEIISEPQKELTRIEGETGPSSSSKGSPEEIDNAIRTKDCIKSEEQRIAACPNEGCQEDEDINSELDNGEQENEPKGEEKTQHRNKQTTKTQMIKKTVTTSSLKIQKTRLEPFQQKLDMVSM